MALENLFLGQDISDVLTVTDGHDAHCFGEVVFAKPTEKFVVRGMHAIGNGDGKSEELLLALNFTGKNHLAVHIDEPGDDIIPSSEVFGIAEGHKWNETDSQHLKEC